MQLVAAQEREPKKEQHLTEIIFSAGIHNGQVPS